MLTSATEAAIPGTATPKHSAPRWRAGTVLLVIIFAGTLARLYKVDAPLLGYRNWRQCDTAAVARNFSTGSMNILYPQVDWRGSSPGYVQSEFPIYSYAVAILYRMFGIHEWLGRALNIGVYILSALLLFHLARRLFEERIALLSVLFYSSVPLSLFFTRSFQPDALMALGTLAGLYFWLLWTEKGTWGLLLLSAVGTCLAVLIKPTSLYLGLPLFYLAQRRFGWRLFRMPVIWAYAACVLIPPILWYHHAATLWALYGNSFYIAYLKLGMPRIMDSLWLRLAARLAIRLFLEIATPVGLPLLLLGVVAQRARQVGLLHWWGAAFVLSILLWPRGHYGHDYYQLPVLFLTAIWMACGAMVVWERFSPRRYGRAVATLLCLCIIGFSAWKFTDMLRISSADWARLTFAKHVARLTEPGAPVVFATKKVEFVYKDFYQHRSVDGSYLDCDPVDFYLSDRKGWSIDEAMATPEFLEGLRRRGAKYFATNLPELLQLRPELVHVLRERHMALEVTADWAIYRLSGPIVPQDSRSATSSLQAAAVVQTGSSK